MRFPVRSFWFGLLQSLVKVLLIAGAVLMLGWGLVQVANWSQRKPVVKAGADGVLELKAAAATIHGIGPAHVEQLAGRENIGWWQSTDQWLSWRASGLAAGTYALRLEYSLPQGQETEIALRVSGQEIRTTLPATGTWSTWSEVSLGSLTLPASAVHRFELVPLRISGGEGVMNFVRLHVASASD